MNINRSLVLPQNFSRNSVLVLSFLFSTFIIWHNTILRSSELRWNSWAYYEWLINYDSGFVRRGLIGHLINMFSFGSEVKTVNSIVFSLAVVFIFLVNLFVWKSCLSTQSTVLIVLSPTGIVWMAIRNEYYFRKEVLFYIVILMASLILMRRHHKTLRDTPYSLTGFIFIVTPLLLLVHESALFFAVPFLSVILSQAYDGFKFRRPILICYLIFALIFFLFVITNKGTYVTSIGIWDSLSDVARMEALEVSPQGGISAIGWSTWQGIKLSVLLVAGGNAGFYLLQLVFLYILITFIVSNQRNQDFKEFLFVREMFLPYVLICITFLPLFILGWDWGRWLMGIWYVSLCVYLLKLDTGLQSSKKSIRVLTSGGTLTFFFLLFISIVTPTPECCISSSGGIEENPLFQALIVFLRTQL